MKLKKPPPPLPKYHVFRKATFVKPQNGSDVFSRTFLSLCDNSILGYITYDAIDEDHPGTNVPNVPLSEFDRSEASLDTVPECPVYGKHTFMYEEMVDDVPCLTH